MSKLTRRRFMKLSATGASALAIERSLGLFSDAMELDIGGKQVSRTTGKFRRAVPTTCLNCYARCGIFGYVENGRIVKLGGNPNHPNSRGRMCAKGHGSLNLEYDPERILQPMRRLGRRGEGKWETISWEEAYDEVARALRTLRDDGHPEQFAFQSERDVTTRDFVRRFMHAFGSPTILNHASLGHPNKKLAHQLTWGVDIDINDVSRTHYMLNFGSNPYEAHILRTSFAQRIADGRTERLLDGRVHNRAKIVTFDVRLSNTAGRSDEWFPIHPGTDGLVALAMANVIMSDKLHDEEFISTWTNYPADELAAHLKQYPLEMAEEISGVGAVDIKRIAYEFAGTKPATTISTGGVAKHWNGVYNERCIALLNIITGNVDIEGGACLPVTYELSEPEPIPPEPSIESELATPRDFPAISQEAAGEVMGMLLARAQKIGVWMMYNANPAYSSPDCNLAKRVLSDENLIPRLIVIDSYMTETAALADVILPAATYLERWELESVPAFERVPFISVRQPVVEPLGESKPFIDIMIDLANRVGRGMELYFSFGTSKSYLEAMISKISGLVRAGGMDYLAKHGVWYDGDEVPQYRSYLNEGFNTPSGKIEIYSKRLEDAGFNPLPVYEPITDHLDMEDDELILTTFQWNVHTHSNTANSMWLSEIVHDNPLWINPQTARERGIGQGDLVRVRSRIGSLIEKAQVTEGIHPRVVAVSDNCGHWEYGRVAQAKRFESNDPETMLIWWEKEGKGAHPNKIIPVSSDPIGGGQAWMDTVVTVSKV